LKGDFTFDTPKFFIISTIILTVSTHFTSRLIKAYETDAISDLRKLISYTLVSGLVFFLSQSLGWMEILKLELIHEYEGISDYLFFLSGVHFIYILAGVVMSAMLFYKYMLIENDPVKTLITTTNPNEKVRLEIFKTFWNFTVYSWGLMFILFLFIF
jgi:cytochrome c oxidase subunit 3